MMTRVTTGAFPIGTEVKVRVDAADADPSILRTKASSGRLSGILGKDMSAGGVLTDAALARVKKTVPADQFDIAMGMVSGLAVKCKAGRVDIMKSADSPVSSHMMVSVVDAAHHGRRTILHREFSLANGGAVSYPLGAPSTETLGETTVRSLSLEYTMGGKKYVMKRKISEQESAIREWNIVGPFAFDTRIGIADVVYGPEKDKVYDLAGSYAGVNGKQVQWQTATGNAENIIDLGGVYKTDDCIAYGLVYLRSDRRQPVTFKANSDDGIEVFINGLKVHSNNVMRGIESETDTVRGFLQNGVNTLLVKISQGSGGWAFRMKVETEFPIESSVTLFK
jgi:hypothetical protein